MIEGSDIIYDTLNTPKHVRQNIETAPMRMDQVTACLGEERLDQFAQALSSLFAHQNPRMGGVASHLTTDDGTTLAIYLLSAGTELQTAWHTLQLGNVPGCQRTIRVAFEMLAIGAMCIVPRHVVERIPGPKNAMKIIRASSRTTFELCNAKCDVATGAYEPPKLKATLATALFLTFLEKVVQVDSALVSSLRYFREALHHPSAHGSTEVWSQHFAAFDGNRAGVGFSPKRVPLYRDCADGIIKITNELVAALDAVATFITPQVVQAH